MIVRIHNVHGEPVRRDELVTLFASGMDYEPYPRRAVVGRDGAIRLEVPEVPVILHAKITIPGYGFLWVTADNQGRGYRNSDEIEFVRQAALSRVHQVEGFLSKHPFAPTAKCQSMLADAKTMLRLAESAANAPELNLVALASGLWAGELAVVERARHKISERQRRDNFLFGCGGFLYPYEDQPVLKEVFDDLFNYATLPFYLARLEPEKGKPLYENLDRLQDEFDRRGVATKAHPLWWAHTSGMPPWTKDLSWADGSIAREISRVIHRSVSRYKGRIHYYDVINESHDWCNAYHLTQQQQAEMTKLCVDAVHEIDPEAVTVINTCFLFGENVADERVQWGVINERNMTPYSYLRRVQELGTDFDAIGIQLYCPARDMMAIDGLYDRYAAFGKPLHLTELGVPSRDRDVPSYTTEGDLYCLRYMYSGLWREMNWSPRLQADWLEDFYTLSYARDEVEALTWWSITDEGSYVPAAGLVTQDGVPKEAVCRLKALQRQWGFDKLVVTHCSGERK